MIQKSEEDSDGKYKTLWHAFAGSDCHYNFADGCFPIAEVSKSYKEENINSLKNFLIRSFDLCIMKSK